MEHDLEFDAIDFRAYNDVIQAGGRYIYQNPYDPFTDKERHEMYMRAWDRNWFNENH